MNISIALESILQNIEQMIHQGKLTEALKEVEKLERNGYLEPKQQANFWRIFWRRKAKKSLEEDFVLNPRLWVLTLKSTLLGELGRTEDALQIIEETITEANRNEQSPFLILEALRSKASVLSYLGRLPESLDAANKGLQIIAELNWTQQTFFANQKANLLLVKGKTFRLQGSLDKALETLDQSLLLSKKLDEKQMIA